MPTLDFAPHDGPNMIVRHTRIWRDVGLMAADEDIGQPTEWCFAERHHSIVVHLGGAMNSMESVFEHGPSSRQLPKVGGVWMIPAEHRYTALAQGPVVRFAEISLPTRWSSGQPVEIAPRIGHDDPFLFRAAERLTALVQAPDDLSEMTAGGLAEAIHGHVLLTYGLNLPMQRSSRRPDLAPAACQRLTAFIEDNLASRLSLARLAGIAGLGRKPFLVAFRCAFGTTPAQYVIERRLQRARRMLAETDWDITTIALASGFASHSHLSTTFVKRVGVTPRHYRRQRR